jgi:hypothetical protein
LAAYQYPPAAVPNRRFLLVASELRAVAATEGVQTRLSAASGKQFSQSLASEVNSMNGTSVCRLFGCVLPIALIAIPFGMAFADSAKPLDRPGIGDFEKRQIDEINRKVKDLPGIGEFEKRQIDEINRRSRSGRTTRADAAGGKLSLLGLGAGGGPGIARISSRPGIGDFEKRQIDRINRGIRRR